MTILIYFFVGFLASFSYPSMGEQRPKTLQDVEQILKKLAAHTAPKHKAKGIQYLPYRSQRGHQQRSQDRERNNGKYDSAQSMEYYHGSDNVRNEKQLENDVQQAIIYERDRMCLTPGRCGCSGGRCGGKHRSVDRTVSEIEQLLQELNRDLNKQRNRNFQSDDDRRQKYENRREKYQVEQHPYQRQQYDNRQRDDRRQEYDDRRQRQYDKRLEYDDRRQRQKHEDRRQRQEHEDRRQRQDDRRQRPERDDRRQRPEHDDRRQRPDNLRQEYDDRQQRQDDRRQRQDDRRLEYDDRRQRQEHEDRRHRQEHEDRRQRQDDRRQRQEHDDRRQRPGHLRQEYNDRRQRQDERRQDNNDRRQREEYYDRRQSQEQDDRRQQYEVLKQEYDQDDDDDIDQNSRIITRNYNNNNFDIVVLDVPESNEFQNRANDFKIVDIKESGIKDVLKKLQSFIKEETREQHVNNINLEDFVTYYEKIKEEMTNGLLQYVKGVGGSSYLIQLLPYQKKQVEHLKNQQTKRPIADKDIKAKIVQLLFGSLSNIKILPHSKDAQAIYISRQVVNAISSFNQRQKAMRANKRLLPLTFYQKQRQRQGNQAPRNLILKHSWRRHNQPNQAQGYGIPFNLQVLGLGQVK